MLELISSAYQCFFSLTTKQHQLAYQPTKKTISPTTHLSYVCLLGTVAVKASSLYNFLLSILRLNIDQTKRMMLRLNIDQTKIPFHAKLVKPISVFSQNLVIPKPNSKIPA